jgi:cellulose synthase/poly-beta-1,6-N-acetylglucosamine synthase-like glycosyltransferase
MTASSVPPMLRDPALRPPPMVDVIIPAYNAAQFLAAAIDSALAQEGVPLRIIVVDDGSTDDTATIARSYGEPVWVVSQSNKGLAAARNRGIAESTAPYLAPLDADDVWFPGKLARQVALLEAHPEAGLAFADMIVFSGDFQVEEDGYLLATPEYADLERIPLGDGAYRLPAEAGQAVMRYNFICPSASLLRREAIVGVGGFDETFRVCEDVECWMRLLRNWPAVAVEERLVWFRRWSGSLSRESERMILGRLQIGDKVLAHPELYPPGAASYFQAERAVSLQRLGRLALERDDLRRARHHLLASLRTRLRVGSFLLFASTLAGLRANQVLLRLKRTLRLRISTRVR